MSGGPPKDGIPALSSVEVVPVAEVEFSEREPVVTVEIDGVVPRAYPIRYLTWHEIANDELGGVPLAVTFCPLCNSALVFDRRVDGRVLEFGVSGKLRNSDMVMFDRQTESWWQQFTGEGIVGVMNGKQLTSVVSWMESLGEFRERNPDGEVMAEPTNYNRSYGANPYAGYESSARPFLYDGEDPPHGIKPLSRVIRVGNRAWPLERLQTRCVEVVGEEMIEKTLASGRGVVALAPHFGAWEYLGMYLQLIPGIAILYKPPSNPRLEKALLDKRRRGGANLIPATASGLRELYAHLRAGTGAGSLPDQHPSGGKGRFAPFFGVPALTAVLVPRLVQRTGCLVVLTACERLPGGRYRVHIMPADEDVYSDDIDISLAAVNRGVERCISIDPAQYLWRYKRFKTRPEGEAPFYS